MKNCICLLCICWMQTFMLALADETSVDEFLLKNEDKTYYEDLHKLRKVYPWQRMTRK